MKIKSAEEFREETGLQKSSFHSTGLSIDTDTIMQEYARYIINTMTDDEIWDSLVTSPYNSNDRLFEPIMVDGAKWLREKLLKRIK